MEEGKPCLTRPVYMAVKYGLGTEENMIQGYEVFMFLGLLL